MRVIAIVYSESACQPVSASLVMSIFPQVMIAFFSLFKLSFDVTLVSFNKSLHGAALGLVNWGIYFGYGLSYVVGNYIPPLDILGQVK